ncbi:trans-1,2-dihydrobenzene-1,2-diol dehydrogenase-like isoform X2 [Eurosta solidaginis]|uniref:trans-1,2-dihydrobenzene-1,2-diol dehydrogenase-like isoform X2 n=1 Tax=Eurosta solidaginis TaxID=178769 RepID=UPI003530FAF4
MMLDHGKDVLCEKPLCMNEDQTLQLIGHSHSKGCFLMEGIWSRCVPAYQYIRKQIESNALGEVLNVNCRFGLPMEKVGRVMRRSLGGGVTLELGVYALQFALWIFGYFPQNIMANGTLNKDGVDEEANIVLHYGPDRKAELMLSSLKRFDNKAIIKGTDGTMTLPELAEVMAQHWKKTHKIVCRISGEMENDTHTELSIVMPLTSLDSVYDIEKKLDSDDYQESMKSYIFMLKDASSDIIGVMRKLFSDNVLFNFNWDGVHGKRSLSKLKLVNSVLFDVFKLQGRIDFEDSMRRCLTLSHNRHKQRRYLSNNSSSATA